MSSTHASTNKVARHRERMRAAGLRPVQFWVPDTRSPEFTAQVRQQCQNLKGDPAEADVLRFTEEAAAHVEGWMRRSAAIWSRFPYTATMANRAQPWSFNPTFFMVDKLSTLPRTKISEPFGRLDEERMKTVDRALRLVVGVI